MMLDFNGKTVLVVGLGESGLAMARFLAHAGARIRVADTREQPDRLAQFKELGDSGEFIGGALTDALLHEVGAVFVSPGLAPHADLAPILSKAAELNLAVWGELELFTQALADLNETRAYQPKLLAITGTNGKTTVTRLTGLLVERAGKSVRVAGNISPSLLDVLSADLAADTLPDVWVLELSSFQLYSSASFNPHAATILNITQDHLDWHGDMAAYIAAKKKIFGPDTLQILNRDDQLVMSLAHPTNHHVSFGMEAPSMIGQYGLQWENGMQWMMVSHLDEENLTRKKKISQAEFPFYSSRLMPVDALQIRGAHNAMNALAALALCRAIELPLAPLLHGLREYKGEPHRVETIATVGAVDYIDDSKGTNVGATVAALKGLGQGNDVQKIILIAGGEGKGQDFSPLVDPIARYVKAIVLIGKAREEIYALLKDTIAPIQMVDTLPAAVEWASAQATEGDMVLLSPACASLDMFKNYAHRAEVFADAVREIALARGEIL